jgi:predicted nucleic acid-binding protein
MANEVFLDTSFTIALSIARDEFHNQAIELMNKINLTKTQIVTTQAIIIEIGNALSKQKYRPFAVQIIEHFEADPNVEIVPLDNHIYHEAFALFRSRTDKEWGLVDCISFVVMKGRHIGTALTADEHFTQAGFRALLREK